MKEEHMAERRQATKLTIDMFSNERHVAVKLLAGLRGVSVDQLLVDALAVYVGEGTAFSQFAGLRPLLAEEEDCDE
jgi:hypothetical protein